MNQELLDLEQKVLKDLKELRALQPTITDYPQQRVGVAMLIKRYAIVEEFGIEFLNETGDS